MALPRQTRLSMHKGMKISKRLLEDDCRVILFYDEKKEKAALIHTSDYNGLEYRYLLIN